MIEYIYQNGEPHIPTGKAPTQEEIKANPSLYPIRIKETEEEKEAWKFWFDSLHNNDYCGFVLEKITCTLPRHHEGPCTHA